jgi:hypothetical protein
MIKTGRQKETTNKKGRVWIEKKDRRERGREGQTERGERETQWMRKKEWEREREKKDKREKRI